MKIVAVKILFLSIALGVSACTFELAVETPQPEPSSPSLPTSSATAQPPELSPTPYPDTPSPAGLNAPLIESPVLVKIRFLSELDGWGVTETQIARTNDGGITWYDVTPPDMTETG